MAVVSFYQVKGEAPGAVDAVLPRLLEKAMNTGPVLVVCPTANRKIRLDEALWTFEAGSFVPHGVAGGPFPEAQPILVAHAEEELAEPLKERLPVVLAGAEAVLEQESYPDRMLYVFESTPAVVAHARTAWKSLKAREGVDMEYWQQGEGGWKKQAG